MLKGKRIITDNQRQILTFFSSLPDSQFFYLTGGTALSEFYIGHRLSYDLDLFTSEKELILPFSRLMEEKLKTRDFTTTLIRRFQTFVEFEIGKEQDKTRVQLAYDSPFRFDHPVNSDIGVKINDYKDIVVDKLLAFFGRAEPRDAVDLFFILKKEDLWELTNLAFQKDPGFDFYWLAVALEKVKDFPDDIERWPVKMLIKVEAKELKELFSTLAKKIMDKIKK